MVQQIGKLLLALIAATLVADPVMACCFSGPIETSSQTTQADKPPCHGSQAATVSQVDTLSLTVGCPGCENCSTVMAAADIAERSFWVESESDIEKAVGQVKDATNLVPVFAAVSIIPSGPLPLKHATPVTLKQKLHI